MSSVRTDLVTIQGDGSAEHPLRSGDVPVTTDGTTILGNGTTGRPLRQRLTQQEFTAGVVLVPNPPVGTPVQIAQVDDHQGITTVQSSSALESFNFNQNGRVSGVVAEINADGTVQVRTSGPLTLTTAQWDVITGGRDGLVPGTTYHLAQFPAFGKMVADPPLEQRALSTRIGVGLNPTTLLITVAPSVQNLADLTFQASDGIDTGQVARVAGANSISRTSSDEGIGKSQAIGIDVIPRVAVQIFGKVVRTPSQWSAVTDTDGLVAGTVYYVDTSTHPGKLTAVAPVSGFRVQVGVALSTTTLLLSTPAFPRKLIP